MYTAVKNIKPTIFSGRTVSTVNNTRNIPVTKGFMLEQRVESSTEGYGKDNPLVPRDENGKVIGYTVEEYIGKLRRLVKARYDAEEGKI